MYIKTVFSLVARAATLGYSCNLHKCKMAAMESGLVRVRLRMGYHSTNLNKSCVTPLYQIIFTRGIDCWGQFGD